MQSNLIQYLRQLAEFEPEIILDSPLRKSVPSPQTTPLLKPELEALSKEISTCTKCPLHSGRKQAVFGVGDPNAQLMFVGEGPGAEEDAQGEPFVGRAGQLLNRIIAAMKLRREEVYIANIVKCRPPGNRTPLTAEALTCRPYLQQQIEMINPACLVALGAVAAMYLLDLPPASAVKSLRGRIHSYRGKPLVVTYHPAALLRTADYKRPTWEDMQVVLKILSGEISQNQ